MTAMTLPDGVTVEQVAEVLTSRVERTPDGCHVWTGSRTAGGYGQVGIGGSTFYTHRLALLMARGYLDSSEHACHHCDNPPCCNAEHLYAGDATSNMRDAQHRGRMVVPAARIGMDHHLATLPPEVIAASVARYLQGGVSQGEMARRLGVGQTTFGNWVRGYQRPDAGLEGVQVGRGSRLAAGGVMPCGTRAGVSRHRRAGEQVCDACREADRAYMRAYKAARKAKYERSAA